VRYRLAQTGLPGKPDVVIRGRMLAVFIDGDYWHGNQWRRRKLSSLEQQFSNARRRDYWIHKIRRNMGHDALVTDQLLCKGWIVLRFWESQIMRDVESCVNMTLSVLDGPPTAHLASRMPERTVAEFFAGIGLMRLGLERQGWATTFANDLDPEKMEQYCGHFPDGRRCFRLADIHDLSPSDVPSVTLATASFPCNDLSLAGAREGLAGKQSSAFWGFTRLLAGMGDRKPPLVLLENVTGFLTSHGGADFRSAMIALNDLGYSVDPFIIDASAFVPQSRQRLFVVGVLDSPERPSQLRERCHYSVESSDLAAAAHAGGRSAQRTG
jgi:DNA mismatch endonuclease Vsr